MKKMTLARVVLGALILALVATLAAPAAVARGGVHLRVEVFDEEKGQMKVNLDVPLTAIESILEILSDELDGNWDMDMGFGPHSKDLRRMYLALRDEDLGNFLEINDGGEHVKVWKDRDAFQVKVRRDGDPRPVVSIYLPMVVLDALFSDPDDPRLNLQDALRELERMAPLTLVEVYEDDETVKVWLE